MDFKEDWKQYINEVDSALAVYLNEPSIPVKLSEAMRYSVFAGGKRLRPVLLLSSCALFGGDADMAMPLACAMEMIHTYSLIHDDLPAMDNDDYRRGRLTNHKVFGEAMAVLAGDGLLSYAFEVMLAGGFRPSVDKESYFLAVKCIADAAGARGMVAGQVADLESEGKNNADAQELEYIHRHKTGEMITAAVLAGALVNKASKEQQAAVAAFGNNLGIAFQIKDDILDVTGSVAKLGKTPGKDEESGKLTYIKLYGLYASKEKLSYFTNEAINALNIFGSRAAFLSELALTMLHRDH